MERTDLVIVDRNATVRRMVRQLLAPTGLSILEFDSLDAIVDAEDTPPADLVVFNMSKRPAEAIELPDALPPALRDSNLVVSSVTPSLIEALFAGGDPPYVRLVERPYPPHLLLELCAAYCQSVSSGAVTLPEINAPTRSEPDIDVMTVDETFAIREGLTDLQAKRKLKLDSAEAPVVAPPPPQRSDDTPLPTLPNKSSEVSTSPKPDKRLETMDFDAEMTADSIDVSDLLDVEIEELSDELVYAVEDDDDDDDDIVEASGSEDSEVLTLGTEDEIHEVEEAFAPASPSGSVSGNFHVWTARDIMTHLERRGLSAVLYLEGEDPLYTVYVIEGRIDWIEPDSDRLRRRLGGFLVDAGLADQTRIEELASQPISDELLIGEILVVEKIVTADQVFQALLWQASSYLWDILALPEPTSFSLDVKSRAEISEIYPSRPSLRLDASLEMLNFFRSFPDYLPPWRSLPTAWLVLNSGLVTRYDRVPWLTEELWLREILSMEAHTVEGLAERAEHEGVEWALVVQALRRFVEFDLLTLVVE